MGEVKMLTQERLRERVSYDPETGVFVRLMTSRGGARAGSVFGTISGNGYLIGMIDYKIYSLHRLAWFWHTNKWPIQIDHINGVKSDNRIINLRPADQAQNEANKGLKRVNTSGFKGVSWDCVNKRWRAGIKVSGKSIFLGRFDAPEEAHKAYCAAAKKHFGEYARTK